MPCFYTLFPLVVDWWRRIFTPWNGFLPGDHPVVVKGTVLIRHWAGVVVKTWQPDIAELYFEERMSNLRKIAKVVLPVAVPGALGLMSATVFAASDAKENSTTLMTDELSLYSTPESQLRYEEPEVGHVEQGVASLRKTVEPYISWCQEKTQFTVEKVQSYYKTVEPGVNTTQNIVKDIYEFLNDPPSEFYASLGVIGFSGILGLYFAKGSTIKRLVFPTGLMALSASMFYPQHAASVARTTKDYIFSRGSEGRIVLEELLRGKSPAKDKVEKTQNTDSQKSS